MVVCPLFCLHTSYLRFHTLIRIISHVDHVISMNFHVFSLLFAHIHSRAHIDIRYVYVISFFPFSLRHFTAFLRFYHLYVLISYPCLHTLILIIFTFTTSFHAFLFELFWFYLHLHVFCVCKHLFQSVSRPFLSSLHSILVSACSQAYSNKILSIFCIPRLFTAFLCFFVRLKTLIQIMFCLQLSY